MPSPITNRLRRSDHDRILRQGVQIHLSLFLVGAIVRSTGYVLGLFMLYTPSLDYQEAMTESHSARAFPSVLFKAALWYEPIYTFLNPSKIEIQHDLGSLRCFQARRR